MDKQVYLQEMEQDAVRLGTLLHLLQQTGYLFSTHVVDDDAVYALRRYPNNSEERTSSTAMVSTNIDAILHFLERESNHA